MEKFSFYNPFDFNDPALYAIPGFILLIVTEFFLYYRKKHSVTNEFYKDAAASLELGIGSAILDIGIKSNCNRIFVVVLPV
jgi:hypothetical protein